MQWPFVLRSRHEALSSALAERIESLDRSLSYARTVIANGVKEHFAEALRARVLERAESLSRTDELAVLAGRIRSLETELVERAKDIEVLRANQKDEATV